jgi:hypothetical protein
VITLCALAPAQAQESHRVATAINDADIVEATMRVTRTIELTPVSMAEVFGLANGAIAPAARRGSAPATASGNAVSLGRWSGSAPTTGFPTAPVVQRTVEDAWQLRVDQTQRNAAYMDVAYQLHGANGREGMLSHADDETSAMLVRLESLTPVVVDSDGTYDVLQGGVVFHLDLAGTHKAGHYRGTLTVTFNNY